MGDVILGKLTEVYVMTMSDYDSVSSGSDWTQDANAKRISVLTKSFEPSGADREYEEIQYFGDAIVKYEKTINPMEIKFDARVDPNDPDLFDILAYGSTDPSQTGDKLILGIELFDNNNVSVDKAEYKNCTLTIEKKVDSEGIYEATLTFKTTVKDENGNSNIVSSGATFIKP